MNPEFEIKENGFAELKKAILIKAAALAVLSAGTGIAITEYIVSGQPDDVNVLPFFIPVLIGLMAFSLNRAIKRQKGIFESYKLTITENQVIREQNDTETITIPLEDIQSISRSEQGALAIVGNSNTEIIVVPTQIKDSENLERILSEIKTIVDSDKKTALEKLRGLLPVRVLGLMAVLYISTNKLIVGLSGTVLILTLAYSAYKVRESKNIDKKSKRGMWLIVLVLFSIIGVMFFKLTGEI